MSKLPPPTPNGPLHLGHASGPYLAGDVYARYLRESGRTVTLVAGVDSHQNYVDRAAELANEPVPQFLDRCTAQIRSDLGRLRVQTDLFFEPHVDSDYQRGVLSILSELIEGGVVAYEAASVRQMNRSGSYTFSASTTRFTMGCSFRRFIVTRVATWN